MKYLFVYQCTETGKWCIDLCENGELIDPATETFFDIEAQATVWAMEMADKWDVDVHWDKSCYGEDTTSETVRDQRFTKQSA